MATFDKVNHVTGLTATAVALVPYIAVKYDAAENVVLIAGAGDDIVGFTRGAVAASTI